MHPLRCKAIASARLKNDKVDAAILAQLLRADLLPEAWIAPPAVRQLRALLRRRVSLVRLATQLRNRIHAVVADFGYDRTGTYWTGPGRGWLAELDLPPVSRQIVTDCLAIIDALEVTIDRLDAQVRARAKADPQVKMLTALPGIGPFTALVMLAEIGDIARFPNARKLASWAGLTPTVRGSDLSVRHGHISKQGSVWLRWVLNQAAQSAKRSPEFAATYAAIAIRPGGAGERGGSLRRHAARGPGDAPLPAGPDHRHQRRAGADQASAPLVGDRLSAGPGGAGDPGASPAPRALTMAGAVPAGRERGGDVSRRTRGCHRPPRVRPGAGRGGEAAQRA